MVKYMKILGNSSYSIIPTQKCLLYRCCVLPITLYSFQLWFYKCAPLSYLLKILDKMQRRAAIWILGSFKMSLLNGIKAIVELIPIKLHLQKLAGRLQLHTLSLPSNHLIECSWICPSTLPSVNILSHSTLSLVIKDLMSKATWSILSTSHTEFFLLFLLFIQNFLWVLESLTIFQTDFLSIYLIKKKMTKSAFNNLIT